MGIIVNLFTIILYVILYGYGYRYGYYLYSGIIKKL